MVKRQLLLALAGKKYFSILTSLMIPCMLWFLLRESKFNS